MLLLDFRVAQVPLSLSQAWVSGSAPWSFTLGFNCVVQEDESLLL